MTQDITSQILKLDNMDFEIFMSGDQGSDKLALFLHGFPQCAHEWRHQMPLLAALGYKCWAPNQRGYGKSYSPPEVSAYAMEHLEADVARFIKASGCKSVTLIAHDWGGAVAWNVAARGQIPLDRLVVMNCPFPVKMARELKKWEQMKKSWYMFGFQIPKLPEYLMTRHQGNNLIKMLKLGASRHHAMTPEDLDVYRANALRPGGMKAMLNWYRAAFRNRFSQEKSAGPKAHGKIQVPTLLLWGEKDVALGIKTVLGTDEFVEHLTVRYIPDAGHFLPEEAPHEVNEMMRTWLERAPVPGPNMPTVRGASS
jgi:pimeloyl-ACP methyl ester carboxylesterase